MTRSLSRYAGQGGRRTMIHPASADAVRRWCGRTPSHGWLFQDAASPVVAAFGGQNLTEVNTVDSFSVATPYAHKVGVGFVDGDNGRLETAAAGTFDDDGVTSQAWLAHVRFGAIPSTRGILGKTDGLNYYALRTLGADNVYFLTKDGTTVKSAVLTLSHANLDTWLWCGVDRTAALVFVASRLEAMSTDITGIGTFSNASKFNVGAPATLNPNMTVLAMYRFTGANAEGELGPTLLSKIARYAGGQ